MPRKSVSNFRSIKEHGKISAAALIPASWHTAISVSRLICTDTPQMSMAETGRTPSVRPLPRRNPTRHTRQRNVCRPFRFHFVTFLRVRTRDTNRSRQSGNFCRALPFPERFLSPPRDGDCRQKHSAARAPSRAALLYHPFGRGGANALPMVPDPRDRSEVTDKRFCRELLRGTSNAPPSAHGLEAMQRSNFVKSYNAVVGRAE